MKLTLVLIVAALLQVHASSFAQNITLNESRISLGQVFTAIKNQTGYDFIYNPQMLDKANPVSIHVINTPLNKVLEDCFKDQPVTYTIDQKTIIVKEKAPSFLERIKEIIASISVQGKVVDEKGDPMPGATISVNGTNNATIADNNGQFILKGVDENASLVISSVGYKTLTLKAAKEMGTIKMEVNAAALDQVQVIGYGTTTKRLNTGSVSTINAEIIEKQPVSNPLAALQGRAPGVFVQTQNGLPDGNIKIQIRGQGSLASGTDPLYIIDGVPFLSAPLYTGTPVGSNGVISPFNVINPGDIESMEILKDADATSIYGSRAANGVILITTKKGAIGKDNFSVDVYQGFSRISRFNQYLNLQQYLQLRREAFKNDNVTPTKTNAPDLLVWDTTKSTNWQKYFLGGTAPVTNIQTSLSGGDTNTHYLFSAHYSNQGTIFPGDENYKKGGGYLNLEHTSNDKRFSSSFSVNYSKDDNHTLYSTNPAVASLPPDYPIYNPDGSFNWTLSNPVAAMQKKQHSSTSYLNINSVLKYSILKNLDAKISFGYNDYGLNQTATIPASSQNPSSSPLASAYFSNNTSERYIIEPQIDYKKSIAKGILTGLIGGTYQYVISQGTFLTGSDVNNPDLLGNLGAAGSITSKSNSFSQYKFQSFFGRLNYNWEEKYLIDINIRRDGSSRFGPGHQFGNFGAIGAGWIFSEEDIFKKSLQVISFGKLRGSYGTTGNDQISDYQYLSTYGSGSTYGTISSLTPSKIANPDYSWETTNKLEFALELGLLKNRIMITSAWYKNTSSNQLISYTIPYLTGFSSYQANFPAVIQNTGIEIELNTQPIKSDVFKWTVDFNITIPKNKLVAFPGLDASSYSSTYVIGQDLSIVKSYQFTGVDPKTGLATFKDLNNDGTISYPADVIVAGKTSPDYFGGFNNSFTYKGIQLDVFLEYTKRQYPGFTPALGSSAMNDPVLVLNRWVNPGDVTNVPRATTNSGNLSNYYASQFSDASYIRLKNLSISYHFAPSVLSHLKLKDLKIYLQAENLLVFANQNRFDPEISSSTASFAPLKTITAGLKFTF